jgi:hypothetical protein
MSFKFENLIIWQKAMEIDFDIHYKNYFDLMNKTIAYRNNIKNNLVGSSKFEDHLKVRQKTSHSQIPTSNS